MGSNRCYCFVYSSPILANFDHCCAFQEDWVLVMARKKYIAPYDTIDWIPLDEMYMSTGLGGPILSSISYQWAQLLGNYDNVVQIAIGNLIHLSFAVQDEKILNTLIIGKALEKFDNEETCTYEQLNKKRKEIVKGSTLKIDHQKYLADIEEAKEQTILNLLSNLMRDTKNECFGSLVYHHRDERWVVDQIKNLCFDVLYLDPTKFSDSDEHEGDVGPWIYNNLLDYFTTKISYIV